MSVTSSEKKCLFAMCVFQAMEGSKWCRYHHDSATACQKKHATKPAESARCTACETRLVDGQCPMCCSQKEGACSGVESAGKPHRNCVLYGSQPAAGDALLDATIREAAKHHGKPQDVEAWAKKLAEDSVAAGEMDALRDARANFRQQLGYYKTSVASCSDADITLEVWIVNNYAHLPSALEQTMDAALEAEVARTISLDGQRNAMQRTITELQNALAAVDSRTVSLEAQLAERNAMYEGMLERADERNGKLVEALTRYGQHAENCAEKLPSKEPRPKCTCGFTDVKEGKC